MSLRQVNPRRSTARGVWTGCCVLLGLLWLSPDRAVAQAVVREARVFDIGAIIGSERESGGSSSSARPPQLGIGGLEDSEEGAWFGSELDEEPGLDEDQLLDLIHRHLASDSWSNSRNTLRVEDDRLYVYQTPAVLEELAGFLSELELHASRVYRTDVAIVPLASLDAVDPSWRSDPAAWDAPAERFDAVARAAGERLAWVSAAVRPGHVETFGRERVSDRIVAHDVDQTGVIPVPEPRRRILESGVHGSVDVLPLPLADRVRVDLQMGSDRRSFARAEVPAGDVDQPARAVDAFSTSLIARLDRTSLVAVLEHPRSAQADDTPSPSFAVLLRVRAPSTQGMATSTRVLAVDVAGLTRRWIEQEAPRLPRGERTDVEAMEYSDDGSSAPCRAEELLRAFAASGPFAGIDDARIVDGVLFVSTRGDRERVREWLRARTLERLAPQTVEVWRGLVETLPDVAGDAALDVSWQEGLGEPGGGRIIVATAGDAEARVDVARGLSYLSDVKSISGGAGFVAHNVHHPVFSTAAAGIALRVRVRPVSGSRWLRLEIDAARVGAIERGEKREVRDPLDEESPAYEIETPMARDAEEWRHRVTLTQDVPMLLAVTPDIGGATQARVARVRRLPAE